MEICLTLRQMTNIISADTVRGFFLLDPLLSQSRHFLVYQRATRMYLVHKDEAKPARVEKLGNECIESRDIVTWFRWFRCGKCCLKDKFTFLMPYFNLIWSCPLQVGWGGKFSRRQWVVSCGCATTPDRDLLLHACALCAMGTVRWSFRGSEKTSGLVIFHVFGPSSYIIIQCRGESCGEPCWTMLNDWQLEVFQGNDYLHDRLQHRCGKGLPSCRCWNLPKPLLLGSKNSTRSHEGQRPKDHALNILVIIWSSFFLRSFWVCVQSVDLLHMQGVHSFLFLVIALDPRS